MPWVKQLLSRCATPRSRPGSMTCLQVRFWYHVDSLKAGVCLCWIERTAWSDWEAQAALQFTEAVHLPGM